jgi:ubiquinone/menaquinone biosynthesis C-methylase UbiE
MGVLGRAWPAIYDRLNRGFERRQGASLRRLQLQPAAGRTLEIGTGTGASLAHYPDAVTELVLTEPNEHMGERAVDKLGDLGLAASYVPAPAEHLPFPDHSFDTVTGALMLCSVPDQHAAFSEIRRVLKPGGEFLFFEHVRSHDPRRARWQDRFERPWKTIAAGCHPNRDTVAELQDAGFTVEIRAEGEFAPAPPFLKPYVVGTARLEATEVQPVR